MSAHALSATISVALLAVVRGTTPSLPERERERKKMVAFLTIYKSDACIAVFLFIFLWTTNCPDVRRRNLIFATNAQCRLFVMELSISRLRRICPLLFCFIHLWVEVHAPSRSPFDWNVTSHLSEARLLWQLSFACFLLQSQELWTRICNENCIAHEARGKIRVWCLDGF